MNYKNEIYDTALETAGLHAATQKIVVYFPHLAVVARTDARTFALNVCRLQMVPGVTLRDYWKFANLANGKR